VSDPGIGGGLTRLSVPIRAYMRMVFLFVTMLSALSGQSWRQASRLSDLSTGEKPVVTMPRQGLG